MQHKVGVAKANKDMYARFNKKKGEVNLYKLEK